MEALPLIALDGPSGVGKSTTAKRVATRLGWDYLDTGAMYRSVALAALRAGIAPSDAVALAGLLPSIRLEQGGGRFLLNGEDVSAAIRAPEVTALVSPLSADAGVREALVAQQRQIGARGRFVVDGRDIGTVVFPSSCCKVFLTASVAARARRRFLELKAKGIQADEAGVARELAERDHRDSTRAVAPLMKAEGAWELDSSELGLDQVVDAIVAHHFAHGS
jgi:cytidylate kinase